jgi:hypothetical protein
LLTTPQIKGFDIALPGENFFFYWKTSASLWESKLSQSFMGKAIYIPINWALHCEHPDQYDFGSVKPEADLKRLIQICHSLSIKMTFLFSIGPAPYLVNGGIPNFLAKTFSEDSEGFHIGVIDHSGIVNKMYSFFNPRVFQYFSKFAKKLAEFLEAENINNEIVLQKNYFYDGAKDISFFKDKSCDFQAGLERYVKQLSSEKQRQYESLKSNPDFKNKIDKEYTLTVENLYEQFAVEVFSKNYVGTARYLYLGADFLSQFSRSFKNWSYPDDFFEDFFYALENSFIPSTSLMRKSEREEVLLKASSDLLNSNYIESIVYKSLEQSHRYELYKFIHVVGYDQESFEKLALKNYFKDNDQWTYCFSSLKEEGCFENIFICNGQILKEKDIATIYRVLMNSGYIFVDKNQIDQQVLLKIELFIQENNLDTQTIKFGANISCSKLGEGKIFLFNSKELDLLDLKDKNLFWNKLFSYIGYKHHSISCDDGVYFYWKRRFSTNHQLDFEQVRRLSVYNPSSYKKKMKVHSHKNFSFLKSIDEHNVNLSSKQDGVSVELKPGGSVSIEYGFFD